jgi:hypothetical protein
MKRMLLSRIKFGPRKFRPSWDSESEMLDIAGVNKGSCNLILNASFYGQVKLSAVISHRILNQAN